MEIQSLRFIPPGNPGSPVCEALINQDVYIGDDPVGHHCRREPVEAVKVCGGSYVVCEECAEFVHRTINSMNRGEK